MRPGRLSLSELLEGRTTFGLWSVLSEGQGSKIRGNGTARKALCRCDCGTERLVLISSLKSGVSSSCGCERRRQAASLAVRACLKHGDARASGCAPEYRIYRAMLSRCYNPNVERYPLYGGLGVQVAEEWRGPGGYERFLAHVGQRPSPSHSLDRHPDCEGNYEPGNVRWATAREQVLNRRTTARVPYEGRTLPLAEVANISGIPYRTLLWRHRRNWPAERLFEPLRGSARP